MHDRKSLTINKELAKENLITLRIHLIAFNQYKPFQEITNISPRSYSDLIYTSTIGDKRLAQIQKYSDDLTPYILGEKRLPVDYIPKFNPSHPNIEDKIVIPISQYGGFTSEQVTFLRKLVREELRNILSGI